MNCIKARASSQIGCLFLCLLVFILQGGTHSNPDLLVYDLKQEAVSDLFINACVNLTKTGAVDGCFVDRVVDGLPSDNLTAAQMVELEYAHLTTMQHMQQELKTGPNGPLIANHAYSMPGVNAAQIEGFVASEQGIAQLQWSGAQGKLVEAHVGGFHGGCKNESGLLHFLAAFLIGAEEYAYFGCGPWFTDGTDFVNSTWHSFYEKPLGEPLGKAVKVDDVYSRSFKSGTKVTFDTKTNTGTIDWGKF